MNIMCVSVTSEVATALLVDSFKLQNVVHALGLRRSFDPSLSFRSYKCPLFPTCVALEILINTILLAIAKLLSLLFLPHGNRTFDYFVHVHTYDC